MEKIENNDIDNLRSEVRDNTNIVNRKSSTSDKLEMRGKQQNKIVVVKKSSKERIGNLESNMINVENKIDNLIDIMKSYMSANNINIAGIGEVKINSNISMNNKLVSEKESIVPKEPDQQKVINVISKINIVSVQNSKTNSSHFDISNDRSVSEIDIDKELDMEDEMNKDIDIILNNIKTFNVISNAYKCRESFDRAFETVEKPIYEVNPITEDIKDYKFFYKEVKYNEKYIKEFNEIELNEITSIENNFNDGSTKLNLIMETNLKQKISENKNYNNDHINIDNVNLCERFYKSKFEHSINVEYANNKISSVMKCYEYINNNCEISKPPSVSKCRECISYPEGELFDNQFYLIGYKCGSRYQNNNDRYDILWKNENYLSTIKSIDHKSNYKDYEKDLKTVHNVITNIVNTISNVFNISFTYSINTYNEFLSDINTVNILKMLSVYQIYN
jgi:hypothetical protein